LQMSIGGTKRDGKEWKRGGLAEVSLRELGKSGKYQEKKSRKGMKGNISSVPADRVLRRGDTLDWETKEKKQSKT